MSMKITNDSKNLDPITRANLDTNTFDDAAIYTGVYPGGQTLQPIVEITPNPGDRRIQNENCAIVMGQNPNKLGQYNCSRVLICAGPGGSRRKKIPPGHTADATPNPKAMAAAFEVSQNSNLAPDNGLPNCDRGISYLNKSTMFAYADATAVVGNEALTLCTSMNNKNSHGETVYTTAPVNLCGGAAPAKMMQPLVLGDNLETALKAIYDLLADLNGTVNVFLTLQQEMNAAMVDHNHFDFPSIAMGILATGKWDAVNGGKTFLSPKAAVVGTKVTAAQAAFVAKDNISTAANVGLMAFNALSDASKTHIKSKNVNTS